MGNSQEAGKILLFGPSPSAIGGVATNIGLLLKSELAKRYTLLLFDPSADASDKKGFFSRSAQKMLSVGRYHHLLVEEKPSAVHFFASVNNDFWIKSAFLLYTKFFGIKTILREGGPFDTFYRRQGAFGRLAIRILLRHPETVIVLSKRWKDFFRTIMPEDRIQVVPNGVRPEDYAKNTSSDKGPYFLIGKRPILFLGALCGRKGLYDMVKAIPSVLARHDDAVFVFAGEPERDEENRVAMVIKECGQWPRNVYFLGNVRGDEKAALLRMSSVFMLPTYAEGFPNALLETMAAGLPVVTTAVGSIPELVTDGENGFIITPGDYAALAEKINFFLDHPEEAARMGCNNASRIREQYDYRFTTEKIGRIYEMVIG